MKRIEEEFCVNKKRSDSDFRSSGYDLDLEFGFYS